MLIGYYVFMSFALQFTEDCFVRTRAVVALGVLGHSDGELLGLIMDMLDDGFVPVRKRARGL